MNIDILENIYSYIYNAKDRASFRCMNKDTSTLLPTKLDKSIAKLNKNLFKHKVFKTPDCTIIELPITYSKSYNIIRNNNNIGPHYEVELIDTNNIYDLNDIYYLYPEFNNPARIITGDMKYRYEIYYISSSRPRCHNYCYINKLHTEHVYLKVTQIIGDDWSGYEWKMKQPDNINEQHIWQGYSHGQSGIIGTSSLFSNHFTFLSSLYTSF
jgi:hypothetical protein